MDFSTAPYKTYNVVIEWTTQKLPHAQQKVKKPMIELSQTKIRLSIVLSKFSTPTISQC